MVLTHGNLRDFHSMANCWLKSIGQDKAGVHYATAKGLGLGSSDMTKKRTEGLITPLKTKGKNLHLKNGWFGKGALPLNMAIFWYPC